MRPGAAADSDISAAARMLWRMPDPRLTEAARPAAPAAEPSPAPTPAPPAPAWRRALSAVLRVIESRLFKLGFVVLMVALGIYTVIDEWSDFKSGLDQLGLVATLEALVCVAVAWLLTMVVWRSLLTAAGSRLPLSASCRIFFIGQLGKYVPGSVWPVLTQMEIGRAYKVPRQRSATVAMLAMMVGLTSGLLATLVGLPFMAGGKAHQYWWVFLFIPVMLVCLHPKVLNPVINRGLQLIRKPPPEAPLSGRTIAKAVVLNLGVWFFYGLQIWVLTARLGVHGADTLLVGIGAYALAWCVGFLIVLAPAGAGPREVILIATLSPLLHGTGAAALAIALVSRGVTIVADLLGAGVAVWLGRRGPGRTAGELAAAETGAEAA